MALKPKLELSKKTDVELDNYTQDKVTKITGNLAFPSAQATITLVAATLVKYATALGVQNGTKADTANKNKLRAELEKLLTKVATQCALDADDDDTVFLTSGFAIIEPPSPVGEQPKPTQFQLVLSDNPGEATASMESFPKARGFSFAWTKDPLTKDSVWTVIPWPKRVCTFEGLPTGSKVWAKGGAVSPDGTINYSDPVSRIIQ
jgi:hypothetical protein